MNCNHNLVSLDHKALHEGEVKELLNKWGIVTPQFRVVNDQHDLKDVQLGYPLVLKVCSPNILHKTEVNGVKLNISNSSELHDAFGELRRDFASEQFLVEKMEKKGLEIIIGLISDSLFGLCIMVGLGGIFTEVLQDVSFRTVPINRQDAVMMLSELRAGKVFKGYRGKSIDTKAVVELLLKVSSMGSELESVIDQLDLNPVIVYEKGYSVVDAKLMLKPPGNDNGERQLYKPEVLQSLFYPKSIAIVGASNSPGKFGHLIVKNVIDGGYKGTVYPVNPRVHEILGLKSYANIIDIPDEIDLAILVVPFESILAVVEECRRKGIKNMAITTGGFEELGKEGEKRAQTIIAALRNTPGLRMMGPNMMGLINLNLDLCAAFAIEPLLPNFARGNIGLIAQSGSCASHFLQSITDDGIGFSMMTPTGNKWDIDESDLIKFMNDDPSISVIAAQLEGIQNGRRFLSAIKEVRKPLVILKSGRTNLGVKAAKSHTAALATNEKILSGVLRQNHVHQVETTESFHDLCKAISLLGPVKGKNVLIVSTSGGIAIIASDQVEFAGLDLPELSEKNKDVMRTVMSAHAVVGNPLDIASIDAATFISIAKKFNFNEYDLIWLLFADPVENAAEAVSAFQQYSRKPVIVEFSGGGSIEEVERRKIIKMSVPVFSSAERALAFLRYFAS